MILFFFFFSSEGPDTCAGGLKQLIGIGYPFGHPTLADDRTYVLAVHQADGLGVNITREEDLCYASEELLIDQLSHSTATTATTISTSAATPSTPTLTIPCSKYVDNYEDCRTLDCYWHSDDDGYADFDDPGSYGDDAWHATTGHADLHLGKCECGLGGVSGRHDAKLNCSAYTSPIAPTSTSASTLTSATQTDTTASVSSITTTTAAKAAPSAPAVCIYASSPEACLEASTNRKCRWITTFQDPFMGYCEAGDPTALPGSANATDLCAMIYRSSTCTANSKCRWIQSDEDAFLGNCDAAVILPPPDEPDDPVDAVPTVRPSASTTVPTSTSSSSSSPSISVSTTARPEPRRKFKSARSEDLVLLLVGGLLAGISVGFFWQQKRSCIIDCTRSMRIWCRKRAAPHGFELLALDAAGNLTSDGDTTTTSADEGLSDVSTEASREHCNSRSIGSDRERVAAELELGPFESSSGDDTWQRIRSDHVTNYVETAPQHEYVDNSIRSVIGIAPAMNLSQAWAVPCLVVPTLYDEPNETDEEAILPVRSSGYESGRAQRQRRPAKQKALNVDRNGAAIGQYTF